MKKKIVTICLVVALLLTAAGGTLAYFTASDDKENTFTVGNVNIKLTEKSWIDNANGADVEDVYPGQSLAKDPVVTNTGNNPCFVRVSVTGLDALGDDNLINYSTKGGEGDLGDNWVLHTDGYYYYMDSLDKGAATSELFDHIVIPTTVTNELSKDTVYSVNVTAQAVQSQGFTGDATNVAAIAAWFATCMN